MLKKTEEIFLTDMSVCTPDGDLDRSQREMAWYLIDYESECGMKGVMAFADPELGAPEIQLPLNAKGEYKIYLGINYTKSPHHYVSYGAYGDLHVKLTRDPGFRHVGAEYGAVEQPTHRGIKMASKIGMGKFVPRSIQEVYWKTAELGGQSLVIRPPGEPYRTDYPGISNLSYVRLVPVTEEDAEIEKKLQPSDESRRLAYIYCTGNLTGHIDQCASDFHPTDPEWFKTEITQCLNNDFRIFNLEVIRGHYCTFKTQIGDVGGKDNQWKDEWVDPLAGFTRVAHENGLKMFAGMRMIGTAYPTTRSPMARATFYWENQQWAKRDRHGMPTGNLSIAFPEVRNYWLSLLKEVLDYGVDGLTIYLHRFRPFVLWEEPVLESFQKEYGEDARKLNDHEPRWLKHRARYVTDFLTEIRALVNQYPGRELAVSFNGGPSDFDPYNEDFNPIIDTLDIPTWIENGIVDYLLPTMRPPLSLIKEWADLAQGKVHIWPDLIHWKSWGEGYLKLAEDYYQAGADGLCFFDAERTSPKVSEWAVTSRLGHRDMFDQIKKQIPSQWRRVPLKYLNGLATKYSFNNYAHTDPFMVDKE